MTDAAPLLAGVRVLDLGDGAADMVTRLLADLGADVLKIEPEGGSPGADRTATSRRASAFRSPCTTPTSAAQCSTRRRRRSSSSWRGPPTSSSTAGRDAGRVRHVLRRARRPLRAPGHHVGHRFRHDRARVPAGAPRMPVLYAMSTALSRSGPPTGTPVLPPDGIASATAAAQATWAVLAAYYHRMRSGRGDYVDFSRLEGVVLALDPPFGSRARPPPTRCADIVAGQAAQSGRLSDIRVRRRIRPDLRDVAAAVARHAGVAGGARSSSRTPSSTAIVERIRWPGARSAR